jgi:hypothetical protein
MHLSMCGFAVGSTTCSTRSPCSLPQIVADLRGFQRYSSPQGVPQLRRQRLLHQSNSGKRQGKGSPQASDPTGNPPLGDEDDEEDTSNVNLQTEQGQQRQPLRRPHRVTVPTWKVRENQLNAEELTESPTTIDLIALNLTNATEQAPQSISEILRRRDKDLWLESMHRELRALLRNKTWEYVRRSDIPPGHKVLTGRWIWVYKRDGTRKSRWVVRGFEQVEGIELSRDLCSSGQGRILPNPPSYSDTPRLGHRAGRYRYGIPVR